MNSSPLDEARAALLRALEELDKAAADLEGEVTRADLVVTYSIGRPTDEGFEEDGGYASTPTPRWTQVALLRRAADALDEPVGVDHDDD